MLRFCRNYAVSSQIPTWLDAFTKDMVNTIKNVSVLSLSDLIMSKSESYLEIFFANDTFIK